MKSLKLMLTGIAFLFVCAAASATVNPGNNKPTKADVVNTYINAIAHGKVANLENALNDSFTYNLLRGQFINTLNKEQLINYLASNPALNAAVTITTSIVQDDDDLLVEKVEFKYDSYSHTDMLTLNKSNDWEITKVVSVYK